MKRLFPNALLFFYGAFAVYFGMRVLPALRFPLNTYGYDYGFYLYALQHARSGSWVSALVGISGGYDHPLLFLLHGLGAATPSGLNALMFLLSVLAATAFYFVWQNRTAGLWAVVLAAFSAAQLEGYLSFLLKGEVGLALLLVSFGFMLRRRMWPAFFFRRAPCAFAPNHVCNLGSDTAFLRPL